MRPLRPQLSHPALDGLKLTPEQRITVDLTSLTGLPALADGESHDDLSTARDDGYTLAVRVPKVKHPAAMPARSRRQAQRLMAGSGGTATRDSNSEAPVKLMTGAVPNDGGDSTVGKEDVLLNERLLELVRSLGEGDQTELVTYLEEAGLTSLEQQRAFLVVFLMLAVSPKRVSADDGLTEGEDAVVDSDAHTAVADALDLEAPDQIEDEADSPTESLTRELIERLPVNKSEAEYLIEEFEMLDISTMELDDLLLSLADFLRDHDGTEDITEIQALPFNLMRQMMVANYDIVKQLVEAGILDVDIIETIIDEFELESSPGRLHEALNQYAPESLEEEAGEEEVGIDLGKDLPLTDFFEANGFAPFTVLPSNMAYVVHYQDSDHVKMGIVLRDDSLGINTVLNISVDLRSGLIDWKNSHFLSHAHEDNPPLGFDNNWVYYSGIGREAGFQIKIEEMGSGTSNLRVSISQLKGKERTRFLASIAGSRNLDKRNEVDHYAIRFAGGRMSGRQVVHGMATNNMIRGAGWLRTTDATHMEMLTALGDGFRGDSIDWLIQERAFKGQLTREKWQRELRTHDIRENRVLVNRTTEDGRTSLAFAFGSRSISSIFRAELDITVTRAKYLRLGKADVIARGKDVPVNNAFKTIKRGKKYLLLKPVEPTNVQELIRPGSRHSLSEDRNQYYLIRLLDNGEFEVRQLIGREDQVRALIAKYDESLFTRRPLIEEIRENRVLGALTPYQRATERLSREHILVRQLNALSYMKGPGGKVIFGFKEMDLQESTLAVITGRHSDGYLKVKGEGLSPVNRGSSVYKGLEGKYYRFKVVGKQVRIEMFRMEEGRSPEVLMNVLPEFDALKSGQ